MCKLDSNELRGCLVVTLAIVLDLNSFGQPTKGGTSGFQGFYTLKDK